MTTEVNLSGPLFDGRATRVTHRMAEDIGDALADAGVDGVRQVIDMSARHRTGNYNRHVQTDRAMGDRVVNDSGIVYGPWLEGTSRRNVSTRFRGYSAFRRTAQRLQARSVSIAEPIVRRRVGEL